MLDVVFKLNFVNMFSYFNSKTLRHNFQSSSTHEFLQSMHPGENFIKTSKLLVEKTEGCINLYSNEYGMIKNFEKYDTSVSNRIIGICCRFSTNSCRNFKSSL